jgi:crossover junction endodeoxyribonuclease RuvC
MRLLGLDPGLRHTGWGVIEAADNRLRHIADGVVHSDGKQVLAERLVALFRQLNEILDIYRPDEAAVEETFVNKNPASTLKLGVARGVVMLAPAERGVPVAEYSANLIKKSVVGAGHAEKQQIQMMVRRLLPGCAIASPDAADALAVAICHAHHRATQRVWASKDPLSPREEGAAREPVREGQGASLSASRRSPLSPTLSPRGEGDVSRSVLSPLGERDRERGAAGEMVSGASRKPTAFETGQPRRLRRDSTDCERIVWGQLRAKRFDGYKFRRQEPILGFTADFVCHERRLIIELDGGPHADNAAGDARRTALLNQAGFRVLRFWNTDVIDNLEGVLETINAALAEASP